MLTTDFVTGSPTWLDLGTPDTGAAARFFRNVFGWEYQSAGDEAGGYGFFKMDGKTVAAMGPLSEEGADPAWTVYFRTSDADATAQAVQQAGGSVRVEPFDVMDAGRMSALTDPTGAEFSVWQPATVGGLEKTSDHNTLCWTELHTSDPKVAQGFYNSLFGWRSEKMEMPGMSYTVLSTADGGKQEDTSFGGIAPLGNGSEETRWIPYFDVTDVDETASTVQENGGSVLMPAEDVPEVGRIAWFADPFGAPFAVIKPLPMS